MTWRRCSAALWRGTTSRGAGTEQDLEVFVDTVHAAFGLFRETPAEDGGGVLWSAYEMDRNLLAVTADGRPVGTAGAYSFELTLPGEILVPTSGSPPSVSCPRTDVGACSPR